ncbi:MAG TPA: hypothetical protein VE869_11390 [Gemmatimonas sp.]|nr:hypothetical protein [Gemmatimonas sp.]
MDGSSTAGDTGDAFARVAAALRTIVLARVGEVAEPVNGSVVGMLEFSVFERNRMLDHCGSDHRPLVDLLLSLGPTLQRRLHGSPAAVLWETRRAPLVHHTVSTRYLQPDVARWAVDAWAAALGLIPERNVSSPTVQSAVTAAPLHELRGGALPPPALSTARIGAYRGAAARAVTNNAINNPALSMQLNANKRATATRALARPIPNAPSWAGGPTAARFGTGARSPGTFPQTPGNSRGLTLSLASSQNFDLFAAAMFVCILLFLAGPLSFVLFRRNREDVRLSPQTRTAQWSAARATGAAPDSLLLGRGAPATVDSSSTVSAVASLVAPDLTASPRTGVLDSGAADIDTTRGTPRLGAITAEESAARDRRLDRASDSALVFDAMLSTATMTRLNSTGASGDYRVDTRVRSVDGSPSCSQVASALKGARSSVERIEHAPGASDFVLASRNTPARMDIDGRFAAGPLVGTTNGVRWTFRMSGRFTPNGFEAQSRVETWAILRWGSEQLCVTVSDLVGSRLER